MAGAQAVPGVAEVELDLVGAVGVEVAAHDQAGAGVGGDVQQLDEDVEGRCGAGDVEEDVDRSGQVQGCALSGAGEQQDVVAVGDDALVGLVAQKREGVGYC